MAPTASDLRRCSGPSIDIDRIRGARVLLVEDNEINQEVAIGQLEDAEVFVDLAENGEIALRMVKDNDYDVVLMDMQMPVMDGIEATRILRADPRFATLPIIAMTANAMASDRELCLEAGMNDHIAKPLDPEQLFGVILRWIRCTDGDGEIAHVSTQGQPNSRAGDTELFISGIDTRAGLKRTGGSRQRYETLLRKFAEQQQVAAEALRAAVSAGDTATAERISHSLKGAAATLGAVALSDAAASAETAIKTGRGVEASIKSLSYTLDPTIAAIAKALPEEGAGSGSSNTEGDAASIKEPLIRLKQLLESDDSEAADFIVDAKARLKGVLDSH